MSSKINKGDVQESGKISTGVRGRDIGIEEWQEKK